MTNNSPIAVKFLFHPVHFLALGLGSGMPKNAPGTWGTLAALVLFMAANWLWQPIGWPLLFAVVVLAALAGIYICGTTARDLGVHDHGAIVWDEFVGLWACMLFVPLTWYWLLAAFVLFRIFDILKPWPIKWADQKVSGGLGIMLDDLIAAAYVILLLELVKIMFI